MSPLKLTRKRLSRRMERQKFFEIVCEKYDFAAKICSYRNLRLYKIASVDDGGVRVHLVFELTAVFGSERRDPS